MSTSLLERVFLVTKVKTVKELREKLISGDISRNELFKVGGFGKKTYVDLLNLLDLEEEVKIISKI